MKLSIYLTLVVVGLVCFSESAQAADRRHARGSIPRTAFNSDRPDRTVQMVQLALQRRGYYPGVTSGEFVWETRQAIRRYRRDHGLRIVGKIDNQLLRSLGLR